MPIPAAPVQRKHADSDALCRYVAERSGGVCLLSFSTGKDSIAAWLQCRRYFRRIVPFYLENPPGMAFVERTLRYYEEVFATPILRMPHPAFARMHRALTYQPPECCAEIEAVQLPVYKYSDVEDHVRELAGLTRDAYVAIGVRQSDSIWRRVNISAQGSLNPTRRSFQCVYDWSGRRVVDEIAAAGIMLPVDYRIWGRSFDGLQYEFLEPLRRHFPDDYARLLQWYPLADVEIFRREVVCAARKT